MMFLNNKKFKNIIKFKYEKNTFKQLVILGGNIYKQDFPIINIINAINKFKLKYLLLQIIKDYIIRIKIFKF